MGVSDWGEWVARRWEGEVYLGPVEQAVPAQDASAADPLLRDVAARDLLQQQPLADAEEGGGLVSAQGGTVRLGRGRRLCCGHTLSPWCGRLSRSALMALSRNTWSMSFGTSRSGRWVPSAQPLRSQEWSRWRVRSSRSCPLAGSAGLACGSR